MDGQTLGITLGTAGIVVTVVLSLFGFWLSRRKRNAEPSPAAKAEGGGAAASATPGTAVAATTGGVAVGGDLNLGNQGMSADERERLVEVEAQLEEIQKKTAAPPGGTEPVETRALAAQATDRTRKLLAEAIQLQNQNKERDAVDKLLSAYDADLPAEAKAALHLLVGNSFFKLSELEQAAGHYEQAREASLGADSLDGEAIALLNLGAIDGQRGDLGRAAKHFEEALEIYQKSGSRKGEAGALGNVGIVYRLQGDLTLARSYTERALEIGREISYNYGLAQFLSNLGLISLDEGDNETAERLLTESLDIHRRLGSKHGEAQTLGNLGNVYAAAGDVSKASESFKKSAELHAEIRNRLDYANSIASLALLEAKSGSLEDACRLFKEALKTFEDVGAEREITKTRNMLDRLDCK